MIFDPSLLQIRKGGRLIGYFQSINYFATKEALVKSALLKMINKSSWFENYNAQCINLHYRRGDYYFQESTRNFHGLLDDDYFFNAVSKCRKHLGNLPVRIFSDSKHLAVELSKHISNSFVHEDSHSTPIETLLKLSVCKAFVGSNSSFSWWSAYIGSNFFAADPIFPKIWIKQDSLTDEIHFPNWITLDNFT
jgi:hypothetical protein